MTQSTVFCTKDSEVSLDDFSKPYWAKNEGRCTNQHPPKPRHPV